MPAWLQKLVIEALMKLLTPELLTQIEDAAKAFAIDELRKLAASTTATDIDDALVEKLAQLLGVPFAA